MRKTVKMLTYGDPVYMVYSGKTEYTVVSCSAVYNTTIHIAGFDIERSEATRFSDRNGTDYFCNKPDAIRFAKAQACKKVFSMISEVKGKLEDIKNFKLEHWDRLNHEFLDEEIHKLENQINRH